MTTQKKGSRLRNRILKSEREKNKLFESFHGSINSSSKAPTHSPRSKIEICGSVLASWSQVVLLGVVIAGYYFTVRPVFQKELLSEDLAKLKIEKHQWQDLLDRQKVEVETSKAEIAVLNQTKLESQKLLVDLSNEKETAIEASARARKELEEVTQQTSQVSAELKLATEKLFELRKLEITGSAIVPEETLQVMFKESGLDIFKKENQNSVAQLLEESFLDPVQLASKTIEKQKTIVDSESTGVYLQIEKKILEEYLSGFEKNKSILACAVPNFDSWQESFSNALRQIDSKVQTCVETHFEEKIKKEGWSADLIETLKESEFWPDQEKVYRNFCTVTIEYRLESYFYNQWAFINEPCNERLLSFRRILLSEKGVNDLTPIRETFPPSPQQVEEKLAQYITE